MNEIDTYISQFPEMVQDRLCAVRGLIRECAPEATERICMGIPTFDMNGKWLVHYAGFAKHIGFYPQPDGITVFSEKLKDYKTTKGTIQFPLNKPLPLELIREITEFRVKQQNEMYKNDAKHKAAKNKDT